MSRLNWKDGCQTGKKTPKCWDKKKYKNFLIQVTLEDFLFVLNNASKNFNIFALGKRVNIILDLAT